MIVGSNFAVMIALAWLLSPDDFGRLVYFWTFALVLSALGTIGAPAFLLRELSAQLGKGDDAPRFSAGLAILLSLLLPSVVIGALTAGLIVLAGTTSLFAAGIQPTTSELIAVGVIAWLINGVSNLAIYSRMIDQVNLSMGMRDAAPPLILLLATGIGFLIHAGAPGVLAIYHIYIGLAAVLLCIWAAQIFLVDRRVNRLMEWRRIGRFPNIFGFWGMQATNALSAGIDVMVGGLFLGEAQLGYYQLVKRIANVAALPQIVANWSVIVALGKAHGADDAIGIRHAVRHGARIALVPLAVLLPLAAAVITGVTFWLGYPMDGTALAIAVLLLAASATNVVFCGNPVLVLQTGLEYWALMAQIAAMVLFGACLLLLLHWSESPTVLASVQFISILASNAVLWCVIWRRLRVDSSLFAIITHRQVSERT